MAPFLIRLMIWARILKHFKVTAEKIAFGKVNFSNGILKQPDFSITVVCHCGNETYSLATGLNAAVLVTLLERQLVCLRIPKMQVCLERCLFKRKIIFSTSMKCLRIWALNTLWRKYTEGNPSTVSQNPAQFPASFKQNLRQLTVLLFQRNNILQAQRFCWKSTNFSLKLIWIHTGSWQRRMYKCLVSVESTEYTAQSAGPVRFLIFCSINIILLGSLVAGSKPQCTAGAD